VDDSRVSLDSVDRNSHLCPYVRRTFGGASGPAASASVDTPQRLYGKPWTGGIGGRQEHANPAT
jgi:hypothetical protein